HLEEALQVAAEALGSHRPALTRVLLVSDGQPTVGEVEPDALISMVEAMRRRGLTLDALGVGEDFNEELLAALARAGDGTYAYLRNEAALPQRLLQHRERASNAVAEALELTLTPAPNVELLEVLGHPLERRGPSSRLRLAGLAAGESSHLVARVRIHAEPSEDALDVAEVELEVHEAGAGRTDRTRTMLRARHTSSPPVAASHRDPALTLTVARALAAQNTARAADALASYQPSEAEASLHETRVLLDGLAASRGALPSPGADALRRLQEELRDQQAQVQAAGASGGGLGAPGTLTALRLAARQGVGIPGA